MENASKEGVYIHSVGRHSENRKGKQVESWMSTRDSAGKAINGYWHPQENPLAASWSGTGAHWLA